MESECRALAEIRLKWFDDSTLLTDDGGELLETFLKSLGITSKPAVEVFQILIASHKAGLRISARDVCDQVVKLRRSRGDSDSKGLTLRNIQVWLKYYADIGLLDNVGDKYMFRAAKKPSTCFNEYTVPIIEECVRYSRRVLEKMEEKYCLK